MITDTPELGVNERSLILGCSRLRMNADSINRTRELLKHELNWDSVIFYSKYHSVAPLMSRNLNSHNLIEFVPRQAYRNFLSLSNRTEYQNRKISQILKKLIVTLRDAGISVIVPKGISLVETVYGHYSLRPLIDINLLVNPGNYIAAKQIFLRQGYSIRPVDPAQGYGYSQIHLFKYDELEIHILLQWHLLNWPHIHHFDNNSIWDNAKLATISGENTYILSAEYLLIYLCIQSDKYGYFNLPAFGNQHPSDFIFREWTNNRLIRYVDVYETLMYYRNSINWNSVEKLVSKCCADNTVYRCLEWTFELLGEPDGVTSEKLNQNNLKTKFLRTYMYEALNAEPKLNGYRYEIKYYIRRWWHTQSRRRLLHILQIFNIVEYSFPNPRELKLLYGYNSHHYCLIYYPFHVLRALLLILLPAIYRSFIKGKFRK